MGSHGLRPDIFGGEAPKPQTSGRSPVKDQVAIARVLLERGRLDAAKSPGHGLDAMGNGVRTVDAAVPVDLEDACAAADPRSSFEHVISDHAGSSSPLPLK